MTLKIDTESQCIACSIPKYFIPGHPYRDIDIKALWIIVRTIISIIGFVGKPCLSHTNLKSTRPEARRWQPKLEESRSCIVA